MSAHTPCSSSPRRGSRGWCSPGCPPPGPPVPVGKTEGSLQPQVREQTEKEQRSCFVSIHTMARILALWSHKKWKLKMLVPLSCPTVCNPRDRSPPGSSVFGISPGKNTSVSIHSLPQGIFPTQDRTRISYIAGRFFTIWATSKASGKPKLGLKFTQVKAQIQSLPLASHAVS